MNRVSLIIPANFVGQNRAIHRQRKAIGFHRYNMPLIEQMRASGPHSK